ncbi:hypothetical protein EDM57_02085 [Brevibacillus gelatini]|uniref:Uncharacterized protein n=1 Tax=Brevibacillus gelatini TaxID=1655277 RepID=A0A3M8BD17_9BACL|nr:hypothetical protein [Brevibacillus gelatini]RNB61173.1 hypothetical protein EDM57_02085 [Brevibacillus gelatini]
MNKWKNSMVIATISLGLTLPSFAQAAEAGLPDVEMTPISRTAHSHGEHGQVHKKIHPGMHGSAHQKMYMLLLAEKYTPDSVNQWQEVFRERERLMSEYAALREDPKWKAKREERRQLVSKLKEQVKKGEITNEQMEQQLAQWKEKNMGIPGTKEERDARKARMEKMRMTHEAFHAAIESGDAAKIKEVLPQMLEQMKAKNTLLAQKLEQRKK